MSKNKTKEISSVSEFLPRECLEKPEIDKNKILELVDDKSQINRRSHIQVFISFKKTPEFLNGEIDDHNKSIQKKPECEFGCESQNIITIIKEWFLKNKCMLS